MSLVSPLLIEIDRTNPANLGDALEMVPGCWKSSSVLWMHSNGFPVMAGLILSGWTREAGTKVAEFCRQKQAFELLLRIEKPGQRWTRCRGGYTLPISAVGGVVADLASEGMFALLLEPASPYSDLYSLTSICDLETGRVDVEVVGPGFDAGDVLRADLTPHERFETKNRPLRDASGSYSNRITRTYIVGPEAYRASVHRRLAKIGARLRNPSFPDHDLAAAQGLRTEELEAEAIRYLRQSGQTTLLDHLEKYEPIPPALLQASLAQLYRLSDAMTKASVPWKLISVAASFLQSGRLVIWDFFPPEGGETAILSSMNASD
jgi:hypothetical protein